MNTSSTGRGHDREQRDGSSDRTRTQDARADYSGGLVGHKDRALDAGDARAGTNHEGAYRDEDDAMPVGSALAAQDGAPAAGSGDDLTSGPSTLGATTGGERASAGRSDANRNSRDHGNSRGL